MGIFLRHTKSVYMLMLSVSLTAVLPDNCFAANHDESPTAEVFFDDFNGDELDREKWLVADKTWGADNGGVVPANVSVSGGTLKLQAHGDQYTGGVLPNQDGDRQDGTRVGAAIATKAYYASGSYEMRARIAPELGVCSSMWTFQYEEHYPEGAPYYIVNHEIDMELPGRPASKHKDMGFDYVLCNTYVPEDDMTALYLETPTPQDDGAFHVYRFDWHTEGEDGKAYVDFYIDDQLLQQSITDIPTNAGRLWLGVWFPENWAGDPDFDTAMMEVDYVRITPFLEAGDTTGQETYPDYGWEDTEGSGSEPEPGGNLVANPDFSEGDSFWEFSGKAVVSDGRARLASGDSTDTMMQLLTVEPNTTYVFSADISSPGCLVDYGIRDYAGKYTEFKESTAGDGTVTFTFTTGSGINEITVFFEVIRYQEHLEPAYIDNVSITS